MRPTKPNKPTSSPPRFHSFAQSPGNRIDLLADNCVVWKKLPNERTSLLASLLAVFLPAGYPHSVTDDYMWYVKYFKKSSMVSLVYKMKLTNP